MWVIEWGDGVFERVVDDSEDIFEEVFGDSKDILLQCCLLFIWFIWEILQAASSLFTIHMIDFGHL